MQLGASLTDNQTVTGQVMRRTATQGVSHARPKERDRHGRAQCYNGPRVELFAASQKGEGKETGRFKEPSVYEGRSEDSQAKKVLT